MQFITGRFPVVGASRKIHGERICGDAVSCDLINRILHSMCLATEFCSRLLNIRGRSTADGDLSVPHLCLVQVHLRPQFPGRDDPRASGAQCAAARRNGRSERVMQDGSDHR
jgi:hypothetical protein